jgi:yecA family protein
MPKKPVPVDLDALDSYLVSDHSPENGMGLSDLDGFLTGIVIGPEPILLSEWLPKIWGDDEPRFVSKAEAESVTKAIMARYEEISTDLDNPSEKFHFLFWESQDGQVIVTDWAAGFLDAMKLRPAVWEPLAHHPLVGVLLLPLLVLGAEDDEDHGLPQQEIDRIYRDGPELIPECIAGIHEFWKERRPQPAGGKQTGRPGSVSKSVAKAKQTHILRVSLKPRLYRDIEIQSDAPLKNLAEAIVAAFEFDLDHAYGFYSKLSGSIFDSPIRYELFEERQIVGTSGSVKHTKVGDAFVRTGSKMLFLYDYGDEWGFKVEVIGMAEKGPKGRYPKVVAAMGKAPQQYPDLDEDD